MRCFQIKDREETLQGANEVADDTVHHHHIVTGAVECPGGHADDELAFVAGLGQLDAPVIVDPLQQLRGQGVRVAAVGAC